VYRFRDSSTVHLGSSGAYTEFASIKLLLVDILSNNTTDSVVGDEKHRVVLPCFRQVYSHLRIPVTSPKPQDSPLRNIVSSSGKWKGLQNLGQSNILVRNEGPVVAG
jgi:hypothetical protein